MSIRLVVLLISIVLLVSGCSKSEHDIINSCGYTEVQFKGIEPEPRASTIDQARLFKVENKSSRYESLPKLSGGLLIYAAGTDFAETLYLSDEASAGALSLPNGEYKFYAIGYANALTSSVTMGSLTSTIRCALVNSGQAITLGGGSRTINIHLNADDCTTSGSVFFPMPFDLRSCSPSYTFSGCPADVCANCSPPGDAKTYRVKLLNYKKSSSSLTVKSAGIQTCIQAPVNAGTVASSSGLILPFGQGSDSPFAVEVSTYDTVSTDCSGVPTRTFTFLNGIYEALNISKTLVSGNLASFAKDISTSPAHGQIFLVGGLGVTQPVANNSVFTTSENVTLNTTMSATDPQAFALTYSIVSNGTLGTATVTNAATGAFQYVPNLNAHGLDTVTFKVNNGIFDSNVATMRIRVMNPFTWNGAGANANWNTALNWYGGVAPNATQVAIFDGTCPVDTTCNANLSPTINVNPNVQGIEMNTGYTGTLTQSAGVAITVGASGWIQNAGTFTGGNSAITLQSGGVFTLTGGTFTSTTNALTITGSASGSTIFGYSGGTFDANNGNIVLEQSATGTFNINLNGNTVNLNHLQIGNTSGAASTTTYSLGAADFLTLSGDFTYTNGGGGSWGSIILNNGTINVAGNISLVSSGWGYTRGGSTNLVLNGSAAQTYSTTFGGGGTIGWLPKVTISNTSGAGVSAAVGTTSFCAESLTINNGAKFTAPTGNVYITGTDTNAFIFNTGATYTTNGETLNFIKGATNTYTINLNGNTVTLSNLRMGAGDNDGLVRTQTYSMGATDIFNVTGNVTFSNTDTGANTWYNVITNNGTINFQGNLSLNSSGWGYPQGGSVNLVANGGGAQSYTATFGAGGNNGYIPSLTVNKAAGTFTLITALSLSAAGQDLTLTSGTINMAGFNLTVNDTLTLDVGTTINRGGGIITQGTLVNNGTINP